MDGILLFIANEIMIRFDEKLHASMKTSDSYLMANADTSWSCFSFSTHHFTSGIFGLRCCCCSSLVCVNLCNVNLLRFLAEARAHWMFYFRLNDLPSRAHRFVSIFMFHVYIITHPHNVRHKYVYPCYICIAQGKIHTDFRTGNTISDECWYSTSFKCYHMNTIYKGKNVNRWGDSTKHFYFAHNI